MNSRVYWNRKWAIEGAMTWRRYPECFKRICEKIGKGKKVIDFGGGVGILANELKQSGNEPYIVDISDMAIDIAWKVYEIPGEAMKVPPITLSVEQRFDYVVATEFLEHIIELHDFLDQAAGLADKAIYAVPNNVLGPNEEPEHVRKFTEESLKEILVRYYSTVQTETFKDAFYYMYYDPRVGPKVMNVPTLIAYCEVA